MNECNGCGMMNETVFYLVDPGERPPFGRVADELWGLQANIDSDGNSRTPDDTQWTELSLMLRDGSNETCIHIDPVATLPLVLQIRSFDAGLAERAARFLSKETNGSVKPRLPGPSS